MKEFIETHKGKIFRYWIHKKSWTPYEWDKKDPDEVGLENEEAYYGYIVEAYNLGYDWLVGITENFTSHYVSYYKLSEIDLAFAGSDQEE